MVLTGSADNTFPGIAFDHTNCTNISLVFQQNPNVSLRLMQANHACQYCTRLYNMPQKSGTIEISNVIATFINQNIDYYI